MKNGLWCLWATPIGGWRHLWGGCGLPQPTPDDSQTIYFLWFGLKSHYLSMKSQSQTHLTTLCGSFKYKLRFSSILLFVLLAIEIVNIKALLYVKQISTSDNATNIQTQSTIMILLWLIPLNIEALLEGYNIAHLLGLIFHFW
jgi:hypothetical protein